MRRYLAYLLLGVLTLTALVSCKPDVPQSELDRFISTIETMPNEAAIDTLRILVNAESPTDSYACYELGNIFYSMAADSARTRGWNDDFARSYLDSAQHWFEQAVVVDTTFVEAYVNLGALWDDRADMMAVRRERDDRIETARTMYEKALAIRPHDAKARCNLGSLYKRQNNFEAAKNEYMAVLENDPESSLAHYNLAILFATQRIYREAVSEFELAVKYDPDGDIGNRSRDNLKIINDLIKQERADAAQGKTGGH